MDVVPTSGNMMADKDFKRFDEYAVRCVHLSPQEEEFRFQSSDSKECSIANSERTPIEINKTNAITIVRILVEQVISLFNDILIICRIFSLFI